MKYKRPPRLPEFKQWVGVSPRAQKKAMLTKRAKKIKVTLAEIPLESGNYPADEAAAFRSQTNEEC